MRVQLPPLLVTLPGGSSPEEEFDRYLPLPQEATSGHSSKHPLVSIIIGSDSDLCDAPRRTGTR